MAEVVVSTMIYGAFFITIAIVMSLGCIYRNKTALTKKRIVRFKPVIEGYKFQRRESKSSVHIENTVNQWISTTSTPRELKTAFIADDVSMDAAFLIRNALTPQECKELIKASELTGFEQRKYSGKGDDSSSCCFQSKMLSNDIIFNRIKQYLPPKSYFDADCMLIYTLQCKTSQINTYSIVDVE